MAAKKSSSRDKTALKRFSEMVRRCRQSAGYANTRAFYQALGGRVFFGCTYKAYLNVENGVSLPSPKLVEKLVAAFRLAIHKEQALEFSLIYLELLIGEEKFFELLVKTLAEASQPLPGPAGPMLRLEAQQLRSLKDGENYWCFSVLSQDKEHWSAPELSNFLELPHAAVAKALGRLAAAGLLARDGSGHYYCPSVGKMLPPPLEDGAVLLRHAEHLEETHGGRLMEHPLLLRASESEFSRYFQFFAQSLAKAAQYSTSSRGPDTALFLIEASVLKILSF